jgi:hypothetical protein
MCDHYETERDASHMQGRSGKILRRAVLVLSVVVVAWLVAFATGAATLIRREQLQVGQSQGKTITCHYAHAAGTYELVHFTTTDPDAIVCAQFISVHWPPPDTGTRWAMPLATDRATPIECRFLRSVADGDGGLGLRFAEDAPLKARVDFSTGQIELADAADLGKPEPVRDSHPSSIWVRFQGGTVPILAGEKAGRLQLTIFSRDGRATMFLHPPSGGLLWSRPGGCRPGATH